jgi:uncharacterized protein YaaQ
MKLVVAVIQGEDANQTVRALSAEGIGVTHLSSSGGFLQRGNATLLIGVDESQVERVVRVVQENCRERSQYLTPMLPLGEVGEAFMPLPIEVHVGGATVFVMPVERFERL